MLASFRVSRDGELTQVSVGEAFMEFLPIMINKLGVIIACEVISEELMFPVSNASPCFW